MITQSREESWAYTNKVRKGSFSRQLNNMTETLTFKQVFIYLLDIFIDHDTLLNAWRNTFVTWGTWTFSSLLESIRVWVCFLFYTILKQQIKKQLVWAVWKYNLLHALKKVHVCGKGTCDTHALQTTANWFEVLVLHKTS